MHILVDANCGVLEVADKTKGSWAKDMTVGMLTSILRSPTSMHAGPSNSRALAIFRSLRPEIQYRKRSTMNI